MKVHRLMSLRAAALLALIATADLRDAPPRHEQLGDAIDFASLHAQAAAALENLRATGDQTLVVAQATEFSPQ